MRKLKIQNLWLMIFSFIFLSFIVYLLPANSFAQCQNNDRNEGLISATEGITGNTLFGNVDEKCVTGIDASYREFKVPGYLDIENQFYTFSRSVSKKTSPLPASLNFNGLGNGIYLHKENLTINTASGEGVQIIFVRGNLDITGDIGYADADSSSGLVFIVQGNVNIHANVAKVNAVIISSGIICTAYIGGSGCSDGTVLTEQLVINGSLISLNKDLSTSIELQLKRNLAVNDKPAEVINKQAKYLYILRNGLFTKDLVITTEDQHYLIKNPGTPSLSVNGNCSASPSSGNLPTASTIWRFTGSINGSGFYNYNWSGDDGLSESSTTPSLPWEYTQEGYKTASVSITDIRNLSISGQTINCSGFTVNPEPPPTILATCTSPSSPTNTGTNVGWSANVTNPAAGISRTYTWSGDNLVAPTSITNTSASNTIQANYSSNGTKSASVTISAPGYTSATVNCSSIAAVYPYNRVFVTSTSYRGNLGSLSGADVKCNTAADSSHANLGGTWKAWMSSSTNSATSRVPNNAEYRLITGVTPVIGSASFPLTDGNIGRAINLTEHSIAIPGNSKSVWTGTGSSGTATTSTCTNWTSTSGSGTRGLTGSTDVKWTIDGTSSCSNYLNLFCFETDKTTPLPSPTPTPGPVQFTASGQPTIVSGNPNFSFVTNTCEASYVINYRKMEEENMTTSTVTTPNCSGTVPNITTTYNLNSLACGTIYFFQVTVKDSAGSGTTSQMRVYDTGACNE